MLSNKHPSSVTLSHPSSCTLSSVHRPGPVAPGSAGCAAASGPLRPARLPAADSPAAQPAPPPSSLLQPRSVSDTR